MGDLPVNFMKSTESAGEAFLMLGYTPPPFRFARMGKVNQIKRIVAAHFGISVIEMDSRREDRAVARPRRVAMFMARELTPLSFPAIGRRFGDKHHTTVMRAVRKVQELAKEDEAFRETLADIEAKIIFALEAA